MSNGRSIEEFVRLLQAMQTSDAHKIATPEGWTPGCDVIVPAPKTPEAIAKRKGEGYAMKDWYFSTKSL
jgi:peroxiredoxin (alkyl hydroperoxide reductase subunit C)